MNDLTLPPQAWHNVRDGSQPEPRLVDWADRFTYGDKPQARGILWTSTYQPDGEHLSDWDRWCTRESFRDRGSGSWWVLTPSEANVYQIGGHHSLVDLYEQFPGEPYLPTKYHWIDWPEVVRVYDAVHVTEAGYWATRDMFHYTPSGIEHGPTTNSWDCESTAWFRWRFATVERLDDPRL